MKASAFLALVSLLSGSAVSAAAVPEDSTADLRYSKTPAIFERDGVTPKDLWKRKGGGRTGGSGGSSGGRTTGGGGGTSTGGGSRTMPNSNTGGRTSQGSGPPPPYSGGTYAGGAKVPRPAGSPVGRIAPFILLPAALAFWPGLWLASAHMYPYSSPWHYHNRTSNKNETAPVLCACEDKASCACDDNNDQTFINETIGDGSPTDMRQREVAVADVNGTKTILINGTLPNGTTADGGEDDSSAAAQLLQNFGYWPVVITAVAAVLAV